MKKNRGFSSKKTKPICQPLAGNPKLEALNPKQGRFLGQKQGFERN